MYNKPFSLIWTSKTTTELPLIGQLQVLAMNVAVLRGRNDRKALEYKPLEGYVINEICPRKPELNIPN